MSSPTPNLDNEPSGQRRIRKTFATLLVLEAGLFFMVAGTIALLVLLLGGLAFLAGGGAATEEKITQTWWMIFLTMIIPFIWPTLLMVAGIFLLRRKRLVWAAVACAVTLVIQIGLYLLVGYSESDYSWTTSVDKLVIWVGVGVVPLVGMIVALYLRKIDMAVAPG